MIIPAYFHEAGVPKTGLSPTVDVYRVGDNTLVVNDGAMTEVGGGFYKYDFAAYSSAQDYLYICDGTATLANAYRYISGATNVDGTVTDILEDTGTTLPTAIDAVPTAVEIQAEMEENGASLLDTIRDTLGTAGAGLTAVPWNASWDAEVESEVQDAIEINNLDHLVKVAKDTSWATTVTKESVIDLMTSKDADQTYARSHDSLEALRDRGDIAWLTGAGQAADTVTYPASVTKIVGGTLTGDHSNLTGIDASYCSLQETTTGTFLELNMAFAAPAGNNVATLRVWGYYAGGGGHYVRVQALDQAGGSIYEDVGTMPIAASDQAYAFNLAPQHIKADGTVTIKFLHSVSVSGIASHVLYLDKVQVSSITPVTEIDANLVKVLDTALTETGAGYLAAGLKKFLDVAIPVFTAASVNQSGDVFALDLPTNTELNSALAAADDAVLAAIAALNNLSSAGAQAAAAAALAAYGAALQTSVDDLESRLTAARAGYLDNLSGGAIATAAAVAALPTTAQINAEVVDALNVDTYAEPGQGDPPATASIAVKIGYLFKSWRNKKDQDASTWKLYNDAGAVTDQKATVSEAGGTVTKGKIGTGA